MVTARNYAAQVERCFLDKIDDVKFIKNAVKFAMPDGGKIFDDNLKGVRGLKVKLPFDCITVECAMPYEGKIVKTLVLARQESDGISIRSFYGMGNKDEWCHCQIGIKILDDWWDYSADLPRLSSLESDKTKTFKCQSIFYPGPVSLLELQEDLRKGDFHGVTNDAELLLEMLEALTCRNITTDVLVPVDVKINERRVRSGKLPIYETKVLVVDVNYSPNGKSHAGGSHASPRQHLRRGHIRRLPIGNIWIQPCVVGDPAKGKIDKQYQVIKDKN